jgi:hypothetical protein
MISELQRDGDQGIYRQQNKVIHKARSMIGMDLNKCRQVSKTISGEASISMLTIGQRWELIEVLKSLGARVFNPQIEGHQCGAESHPEKAMSPEELYPSYLMQWNRRFPKMRRGFASNKQLAWIQVLWELDFTDGKGGMKGLRKFIYRQTMNLSKGPISDLAFLRESHVEAVITPLKEKAIMRQQIKEKRAG